MSAKKKSKFRGKKRGGKAAQAGWRVLAAKELVCVGLMVGMMMSATLWSADRLFPLVPVFDWIPSLPSPLDRIFFYAVLAVIAQMMILPRTRTMVRIFLGAALVLALQDQMRWQPWFYQYLLCLLPFAWWAPGSSKTADESVLSVLRMIIVAIYFWGGLHKLGGGFVDLYNRHLMREILEWLPEGLSSFVESSGYFVPWIEMGMAICLLIPKTRNLGVILIGTMHVWILMLIGPFGQNVNSVVWPWNFVMIALVAVLFFRVPHVSWKAAVQPGIRWVAAPVAILVLVMPMFSWHGHWDRYLSFHLYSGRCQRMFAEMTEAGAKKLGAKYKKFIEPSVSASGKLELDYLKWSLAELNVPTISEDRILLKVSKQIANEAEFRGDELTFIRDYPHFFDERGFDRSMPDEIRRVEELGRFRNQTK